jgi:hypothetical protein
VFSPAVSRRGQANSEQDILMAVFLHHEKPGNLLHHRVGGIYLKLCRSARCRYPQAIADRDIGRVFSEFDVLIKRHSIRVVSDQGCQVVFHEVDEELPVTCLSRLRQTWNKQNANGQQNKNDCQTFPSIVSRKDI